MQALNPIGFDKHIRIQIESNICQSIEVSSSLNDLIQAYSDCFYLPMLIVYNVLDKIYLAKYRQSKYYAKYTHELMKNSIVKSTDEQIKKKKENFKHYMEESEEPLLNDNNDLVLNNTEKLQIGRIDPLGRYITDLDTQNNQIKNENTLKKPLKKLVNLISSSISNKQNNYAEETEEEKALKVAEMLIADVMNT